MRCTAVVVLCVLLSTTAAHAKGPPPKSPLVDEICGDVSDGASVRIFATPVTDISQIGGRSFDKCDALDSFMSFVDEAIEKDKSGRGRASRSDDRVDCSNPDVTVARLSNAIPRYSKTCDITKAYLDLFFQTNNQKSAVLWFPPPMFCSSNGRRRLMQDPTMVQLLDRDGGSFSVSSSSGNSRAAASVEGGSGTKVELSVSASEGPGSSRASSSARVVAVPNGKAFALTACKGTCCITLIISGEMFGRLSNLASSKSCRSLKPPSGGGGGRLKPPSRTGGGVGRNGLLVRSLDAQP